MASVDQHAREIAIKIVYCGPGLAGKTSSLQFIHRMLRPDSRGQLVSLATGVDRTLYFDFMPVKLPRLRGYAMRVQLYTVPGQVHYNSTRKLVLTGVDGVVFVADSQRPRMNANVESLENLAANLAEQGQSWKELPLVLMLNKRDAPDALPVAEINARLNERGFPSFESVATRGVGVFDALKTITAAVLAELRSKTPLEDLPVRTEGSGPFGEVADALSRLGAGTDGKGSAPLSPAPAAARDSSDLVEPGKTRDALAAIAAEIERGGWAAAIRLAAAAHRELAGRTAGALALHAEEAPALAALLCGVPATRYLRFRELTDRAQRDGAITSTDALFALFFVTDLALRAEDASRPVL